MVARTCAQCKADRTPDQVMKCGQCSSVFYCNKECQTLHWKAEHRKQCMCMALSKAPKESPYEVIAPERSPGSMGKFCRATRRILKGEQMLEELPLVGLLFYSGEALQALSAQEQQAMMGDTQLSEYYFPADTEHCIPSVMLHEVKSERIKCLANLLSILIAKHPYIGGSDYFHTTLVGSGDEKLAAEAVIQWMKLNKQAVDEANVSKMWGMVLTNVFQLCPLLSESIGIGFFPSLNMVNHSCHPNAEFYFSRGRAYIHAREDIPSGAEITVDYNGGRSCIMSRAERSMTLLIYNNFECRCLACQSSQDIVPDEWTLSTKTASEELVKKVLTVIQTHYAACDYDSTITETCKLWTANQEQLIQIPCTLINLAYCLSISVARTLHKWDEKDVTVTCYNMISYTVSRISSDEGLKRLSDGSFRSLERILDVLNVSLLVIMFKGILIGTRGKSPEVATEAVNQYLKMTDITWKHQMALIGPPLGWMYSRPLKMNPTLLDSTVNPVLKYLPELVTALVEKMNSSLKP